MAVEFGGVGSGAWRLLGDGSVSARTLGGSVAARRWLRGYSAAVAFGDGSVADRCRLGSLAAARWGIGVGSGAWRVRALVRVRVRVHRRRPFRTATAKLPFLPTTVATILTVIIVARWSAIVTMKKNLN